MTRIEVRVQRKATSISWTRESKNAYQKSRKVSPAYEADGEFAHELYSAEPVKFERNWNETELTSLPI